MTVRVLLYIEKYRRYYSNLIKVLRQVHQLEIFKIVCKDASFISIDGVTHYNGSLVNCIYQTKIEVILLFSISKEVFECIHKLYANSNQIQIILLPLNVDLDALKKFNDIVGLHLFICNPFRHMDEVWLMRERIKDSENNNKEWLNYTEMKINCPVLDCTDMYFGSDGQNSINIDSIVTLFLLDIAQFITDRQIISISSTKRSFCSELHRTNRNEQRLSDYSVLTGLYKVSHVSDTLPSLTSKNAKLSLPHRTLLIRINNIESSNTTRFKMKVKMSSSLFTVRKPAPISAIEDSSNSKEIIVKKQNESPPSKSSSNSYSSQDSISESESNFWSHSIIFRSICNFMRQLDILWQQSTPRLVDIGIGTERDVQIIEECLMKRSDLLELSKMILVVQ